MTDDDEYIFGITWVKRIVRSSMVLRGIGYAELSELLGAIGITESEANLRNKINRGAFSAYFFLQCMDAMGFKTLDIPSYKKFTLDYDEELKSKRGRNRRYFVSSPDDTSGTDLSELRNVKQRKIKEIVWLDKPRDDSR